MECQGVSRTDLIVDVTARINGAERGDEILKYLYEHPEIREAYILDDDRDMGVLLPLLFKTNFNVGLTEYTADAIIAEHARRQKVKNHED